MRIVDPRKEATPGGGRVVARIVWEDAPRPEQELFFETEAPFAAVLRPREAAFLTAAVWPAYHAGERRICVEGEVCPRLRDGLLTYLRILAGWHPPARPLPAIEATRGFAAARPAPARRTAMFLSGGVDSLALLRDNRRTYPFEHPRSVREAFFVHGLDIGSPGQPPRLAFYARARRALEPVAAECGVRLVPVSTNVRRLDPDGRNWPDAWFGPGTVALAHGFDGLVTDVLLAANLDVEGLAPSGSHPLLDTHYSSAALEVHHEGIHQSRLEKIRSVMDWPAARSALRVCWQDLPDDAPLNCGRCRKCVRAMLGLIALGRLADAPTFPRHDLAPADLAVCTVDAQLVRFYAELLAPLARCGRDDLARVLRRQLRDFERAQRWPRRARLRRWAARQLGAGRR